MTVKCSVCGTDETPLFQVCRAWRCTEHHQNFLELMSEGHIQPPEHSEVMAWATAVSNPRSCIDTVEDAAVWMRCLGQAILIDKGLWRQ